MVFPHDDGYHGHTIEPSVDGQSCASANSFDTINEFYFSGQLKPLDFSRFVVNLHTFLNNMKCSLCDVNILLEDSVGVLPSGISGNLVVKCRQCGQLVRVAMDKTHVGQREHNTGSKIFDVNTKLATGKGLENNLNHSPPQRRVEYSKINK